MSDTDVGLQLVDVSHCHGDRTILSSESFVLSPGSTLMVTGANGVGKSTLLYLCAGLVPADAGRVKLGGASVDPSRPSDMVRKGVRCGFVFQQGGLLANLSALANVALGMHYHADVFGLSERSVEERARFCLGAVGVSRRDFHALPGRLSFGICKRVALARAMAVEPNIAFFDDPDAGLDRENASVVHDILASYRDDPSVTLVVATNRLGLIERLASRMVELRDGHLWEQDLASRRSSALI